MKTLPNTHSIRNTIIAVAAVSAIALPLLASASTPNISVAYDKTELRSTQGQLRVYARLQNASRELCGESNILLAGGSLGRSVANEECYAGTLTAAVERLDNDAITALHYQ